MEREEISKIEPFPLDLLMFANVVLVMSIWERDEGKRALAMREEEMLEVIFID